MQNIPYLLVSSITPHFGEEPPLSGTKGAGAIFFSNCNLRCTYCQNHQISYSRIGEKKYSPSALADEMLKLQDRGCHNIDLVSPSHLILGVRATLEIAKSRGLVVPVVYNSNAYDPIDQLRSLDGLVDIYLPDLKYSNETVAEEISRCKDYVSRSRLAVKEMYRQVGNLGGEEAGSIAKRGLIIRLLVLPGDLGGMTETLGFIADEISTDCWLSVLSQYNPKHISDSGRVGILDKYPALGRAITEEEYQEVISMADALGFSNYWIQPFGNAVDHGSPDFSDKNNPFRWEGIPEDLYVNKRVTD